MICHYCGKEIKLKGKTLLNGKILVYQTPKEKIQVIRCNACYKKDPALKYQDCEVYSRIVGYLRPISQWHKGKKEEYRERKDFKIC